MPKRPPEREMRDVSGRDVHGIPNDSPSVDDKRIEPVDEMHDRVKANLKAWKEGLERSFPVERRPQR